MEGIQYGIQQGYNPMTAAAYASQPYGSQFGQPQFGQQGSFGGFGNPLSGLIGSGIAGLFGAQNIGRQPAQVVDGAGGMFHAYGSPYGNIDPMPAGHIQQAQLAQLVQQAQLAQQAQLVQQAQLAQQLAQQQFGRVSPFGIDPISLAMAQQRGVFGHQGHQAPWIGMNPLNRIDPITAAYAQQALIAQLCQQLALQGQLGQQGQFGHQLGHGQFGQSQFGQGQLGQGWLGGGQNLWANPQLGRGVGYGSQLPIY